MQLLKTYLRKEWREQRLALGGLALGLSVAVGVVGSLLSKETLSSSFTYDWVVSICFGAALVTVGSDLFGRERQSRQLGFLERLPAGLGAAFRAKLAFFALLLVGAVGYGLLLAALVSLVFTGELPAPVFMASRGPFLSLALLAALWIFAVSTWVPTSVMTLPVTAVVVAVCLLPGWLMVRGVTAPLPGSGVFWPLLVIAALGALICARVCFVNAAARSRPRRVAVWWGLGLTVLSFTPYSAWARAELVEWQNWPFRIRDAYVGEGERFAFVNLERYDPLARGRKESRGYSALVLDLDTGGWRLEGEAGPAMFSDVYLADPLGENPEGRPIGLYVVDGRVDGRVYDASTGLPTGERYEPSFPASSCAPEDFGLERFEGKPRVRWAGLGQVVRFIGEGADEFQYVRTPTGQSILRMDDYRAHRVRALEERFLIVEKNEWSWIDPQTHALSPFEPLREGEKLGPTLTDGTLIAWSATGVCVLDPITGARTQFETRGIDLEARNLRALGVGAPRGWREPVGAEAQVVATLYVDEFARRRIPALLDLAAHTLRVPDWEEATCLELSFVWSDGPRAIAIEGWSRLVHYDFETEERRVLFDVAELQNPD